MYFLIAQKKIRIFQYLMEEKQFTTPDYRTTIIWKPDVVISEDGKVILNFTLSISRRHILWLLCKFILPKQSCFLQFPPKCMNKSPYTSIPKPLPEFRVFQSMRQFFGVFFRVFCKAFPLAYLGQWYKSSPVQDERQE